MSDTYTDSELQRIQDDLEGHSWEYEACGKGSEAIAELRARVAELEAENERLRTALHDAIDRPKGVVPESAESFYEPMRCLQAEAQRMGLYGGSK